MSHSVYTTPQSVTSKKTPRRRAMSPRRATYHSPLQVIDLNNETNDGLKRRLSEAEDIIQKLRSERDDLHETLIDTAGLNESVIIEKSNKVSTQETRIYTRNISVLEEDLKQKHAKIRDLEDKCAKLELEKGKLEDNLKKGEMDKKGSDSEVEMLRERCHELEEQVIANNDEICLLNQNLHTKSVKMSDFEAELAKVKSEKLRLEERIERMQRNEKKRVELLEKERKSMDFEQENTQKVLSEVRQLSDRLEYLTPVRKVKAKEQEEFLQLSAKVIEETMSDLKIKNSKLEKELMEKQELIKVTRDELEELRKTMEVAKGDSDQASKYLHDENTKILQLTRQKADIRCDLIEARRKLEGFDKKREELEKQRDDALEEVRRIKEQKLAVEKEMCSLSNLAAEREEQIEELQMKMSGFEVMKKDYEAMKNNLSEMHERLNQMGKHLVMADQQTSRFKSLKETAEGSRRRAIEQCNEMVAKIRNYENLLENQRKIEQELETLRAENDRKQMKIDFMQEEIQEVHLDYRQELSRMASSENDRKTEVLDVENLKLKLSQKESELRSAKKTVEEVKNDNSKLQQILEELRLNNSKILEENVRLRKGMADALEKIEEYKRNWQNAQDKCDLMKKKEEEATEQLGKVEEELQEKTQQVAESEQVVAYLHSQINAKQNKQPKLGRRSTLLSTVSEMDTSVYIREAEEVRALEEQRQELLSDLAAKRRQLADSKRCHSTANTTTTVVTSSEVTSHSASELSIPKNHLTTTTTTATGIMRHDIPHKWKDFRHLGVLSIKCSLCFVGIPTLAKAKKCSHCDVQVHSACAPRVNNTCGMPAQCATYYRENLESMTTTSSENSRMNGWLRVYRDDQPGATWIASWAMMDLTRISFYTNDGADLDKPFFTIDLNQEQWVLRTGQEMPIDCDDSMRATNVLMIKMPRRSIYILAPSQPSARRWADCLQTAQRKRMMLNSKPSSMAEFQCLLVLNSPNNLKIFKAYTIEDWILFATQTGLFFTSISQPRNPLRIAGPNSVTCLEIMSEIRCVAMVANSSGQLALCPMESLILAMQSTQPSIRSEVLPEFGHVHAIKYHQANGCRFLIISDDTHLHIRKYNATRDVFSHFAKIQVPEPVTFVESTPNGIIFASDTFYLVSLDSSPITTRPLLPPKSTDYPVSAQFINSTEILLAYQNHGIFVNQFGEQTRKSTIEWEKMPMEFYFTSPFLYIIHDDSIEIVEISENPEKTIMTEREVFECVNAHIIGRQFEGVLISVSSKDSTEVHRFTAASTHPKMRNNVTKRRGVSPFSTLKRTKN